MKTSLRTLNIFLVNNELACTPVELIWLCYFMWIHILITPSNSMWVCIYRKKWFMLFLSKLVRILQLELGYIYRITVMYLYVTKTYILVYLGTFWHLFHVFYHKGYINIKNIVYWTCVCYMASNKHHPISILEWI